MEGGQRWVVAAALALLVLPLGPAAAEPAPAGADRWVEQGWSARDGLPQAIVTALLASASGHLWLGTQEGLVRFDGRRFLRLERGGHPELVTNQVDSLQEAADGAIWIGTSRGGAVLRGDEVRRLPALEGMRVTSLLRTPDGAVWAGGAPGGLVHLHAAGGPIEPVEALRAESVRGMAWHGPGHLLVATDRGALDLTREREVERVAGVPDAACLSALVEESGTAWLGCEGGLYRRFPGAGAFQRVAEAGPGPVPALLAARDGSVWVGRAGGVLRFNRQAMEVVRRGDLEVLALAEDREGAIWAGTAADGLRRFLPRLVDGIDRRHGLTSEAVRAVLQARDGSLWVGTESGGLDHVVGGVARPVRPDLLGGRRVRALLEDAAGTIWVGADGVGAFRLDPASGREVAPLLPEAGRTYAFLEDGHGTVWVGRRSGLVAVRGARVDAIPADPALPQPGVTTLALLPDGTLVAGGEVGAAWLTGGALRPLPAYGGRGREGVSALMADPDGTLWIGTTGDGLKRVRGGALVALDTARGLRDDAVHAVLDDGAGHLWLSGNLGIFRISRAQVEDLAAGRRTRLEVLGVGLQHGMRSPECNGFGNPVGQRVADGRMWFATMGGAVRLDPAAPLPNLPPPAPSIEAVLVDGHPVAPAPRLSLPVGARRLEVRFAATSLTSPETVRVRRQLVGLDDEPAALEQGAGSASYGPLRPGAYRFELTAAHEGSPYGQERAGLALEVPPRFFETGWFLGLAAAAALGAVVAAVQLRTRALRARERELQARVQEALAAAKVLRGLLPICAWCKKIRDDAGYWNQIEAYVSEHTEAEFTHGMCPSCAERHEARLPGREG